MCKKCEDNPSALPTYDDMGKPLFISSVKHRWKVESRKATKCSNVFKGNEVLATIQNEQRCQNRLFKFSFLFVFVWAHEKEKYRVSYLIVFRL
jgi:hypothetical protein